MSRRIVSGECYECPGETRMQILYERSDTGNQSGMNRATDAAKWLISDSSADANWRLLGNSRSRS